MSKLRCFLAGALSLLLIQAVAAAIVLTRARGLSAREEPTGMERWIARRARDMALPAGAKALANPVAGTEEALAEAREHWADHCASCHANDGSGDVAMGKHMYPPAPDMRKPATQNLSDGELFYIIQNESASPGCRPGAAPIAMQRTRGSSFVSSGACPA